MTITMLYGLLVLVCVGLVGGFVPPPIIGRCDSRYSQKISSSGFGSDATKMQREQRGLAFDVFDDEVGSPEEGSGGDFSSTPLPASSVSMDEDLSADELQHGAVEKDPSPAIVIVQKWKELNDYLHKINRPKRLSVSTHSAFSTLTTGFFFGAVIPHLSPGFHSNGLPRLYDFVSFDNAFLAKTTGLMFAVSAVTGVLRLPPNSSKLRRLMFESCAWATVLLYTLQDSNIFMLDGGYTLDLFDGPGWFLTFTVFVGTVISTLEYLVEGIAGSDDREREFLPFGGNRFGMASVASFAYLGISPLSLTIPPWFFDRNMEAFESIVVPALHLVNGWNLSVNFIIEAYMGFGMLVSTLLFEKKINQNQAAALLMLIFFVTGAYDQFAVLLPAPVDLVPQELQLIAAYSSSVTAAMPINEIFFSLWAVSLTKGLFQLNSLRAERREQEQQQLLAAIRVPVEEDGMD